MRLILSLFAVSLLFGCEAEEHHISDPPRSIIDSKEFEPTDVEQIDSEDASYFMTEEGSFQVNGTDVATSGDYCLDQKLEKIVASADQANISFRSRVDLKECFSQVLGSIPADRAELNLLAWYGCDDGSLKSFDGKALSEVEAVGQLCADGSVVGQIVNIELNIHLKGIANANEIELQLYMATALQGPSGSCNYKKSSATLSYGNDCFFLDKSRYEILRINGEPSAREGQESFLKLEFRDLVESVAAEKWYDSGSMGVTLNNWTGLVSYSGTSVNPTWNLSDGQSEISGTLQSAGYGLASRAKKRLAERIKALSKEDPSF